MEKRAYMEIHIQDIFVFVHLVDEGYRIFQGAFSALPKENRIKVLLTCKNEEAFLLVITSFQKYVEKFVYSTQSSFEVIIGEHYVSGTQISWERDE